MFNFIKILFVVFFVCSFPMNAYANNDSKDNFFTSMNEIIDNHENDYSLNIPRSIVLAQIALETGFGESYAFTKKNNIFGLTLNGRVMRFKSKSASIKSYFYSLYFNEAYENFRNKLKKGEGKRSLIHSLSKSYSENPDYASLIINIIKRYSLEKYDS